MELPEPEPEPQPQPEPEPHPDLHLSVSEPDREVTEREPPASPVPSVVSSPLALASKRKDSSLVQYRTLKHTDVFNEAGVTSAKIAELGRGEVFQVMTTLESGGATFGEIQHKAVTFRGYQTGWIRLTNVNGDPLCATESAVQELLRSVPLLQQLAPEDRENLASVLEGSSYAEEQAIIDMGATGDGCKHMYFVESGAARAIIGNDVVRQYGRNDFFGELALLTDEPRKATVRAGPGGCRCLKLGRDDFNTFASECTEILDQRRKQYAMVHVINVSEPALRSYLARADLRDKRPGSRESAPMPGIGALKLLCKIVANAPARVKTSDAALGHQHLDRRVSADGHAEDLLENDIVMLAKMLRSAMARVETTYLDFQEREERQDQDDMENRRVISQPDKRPSEALDSRSTSVTFSDTTAYSDGRQAPIAAAAPATPTKQLSYPGTPGNRTAQGTPSGNTASMASAALPPVDPHAKLGGDGQPEHALNRAQRHHIRNFLAIGRDVQLMMEKYGFSDEDVLKPFLDPTYVFGRKQGNSLIPFLESLRTEQPDVDRLLVVVSHRLKPRGGRSYADEQQLKALISTLEADRAALRRLQQSGKEKTKTYVNLASTCEKNALKIRKLQEMLPFGHAPAFHYLLTEHEGHTLATMCAIPRYRTMLTSLKYDEKRAASLVDTLVEGLLLDPHQPRKMHNRENFEQMAPRIQQDFTSCIQQLSVDTAGRRRLLDDDRVVKSLCMVAVAGKTPDAQRFAKAALDALKPAATDEQNVWCETLEEVATTEKWPEGTEDGKPYAKQLAAKLWAQFERDLLEIPSLPEGDPSALAAAARTSALSPLSPTQTMRQPIIKGANTNQMVMGHALERAAQKLKVKDGKQNWRVLSGKKGPAALSKPSTKAAKVSGTPAEAATTLASLREIQQKLVHREGEDLGDFVEAAIAPFAQLFIRTDDFAKKIIGQWATVICRDEFGMKTCSKVLVKSYDRASNLFLVRTHTSHPSPLAYR